MYMFEHNLIVSDLFSGTVTVIVKGTELRNCVKNPFLLRLIEIKYQQKLIKSDVFSACISTDYNFVVSVTLNL